MSPEPLLRAALRSGWGGRAWTPLRLCAPAAPLWSAAVTAPSPACSLAGGADRCPPRWPTVGSRHAQPARPRRGRLAQRFFLSRTPAPPPGALGPAGLRKQVGAAAFHHQCPEGQVLPAPSSGRLRSGRGPDPPSGPAEFGG